MTEEVRRAFREVLKISRKLWILKNAEEVGNAARVGREFNIPCSSF